MRQISFNSESGVILPIVIILMIALIITGIAFLNAAVMENKLARREVYKNQAFYLAEAGLERTIWNLKQDFINDGEDWTKRDAGIIRINGVAVDDGSGNTLQYDDESDGSVDLGEGFYVVKLEEINSDKVKVVSTGTVKGLPRTVQVYVQAANVSPWNNAIFAGVGAGAGTVIEGNSLIHGSVLILGKEIGEAMAMDFSGKSGIRNNYNEGDPFGIPSDLADKIPVCPKKDELEDLDAFLRVKEGPVVLDGDSTLGESDNPGNYLKETMDGVFVTGDFIIRSKTIEQHIFSDNGFDNDYDLGETVEFPSLKNNYVNPDTGEEVLDYPYLNWLHDNSLHITGISEISSDIDSFGWYVDLEIGGSPQYFDPEDPWPDLLESDTYIAWEKGSNLLTINGIIFIEEIEGYPLSLDLGKTSETTEYSGSGTIVVAQHSGDGIAGEIVTHGDVLAQGDYELSAGTEGFPTNALGLVTGRIYVGGGESQRMATGAFFAENEIVSSKQNRIAGTFVSNHFYMEAQVPRIYQVPALAGNLPPGMPGGTPIWYISTSQWSEV